MADKEYASVAGFIQFDPIERDWDDKTLLNVAVRSLGSQELVSVTIWPEFDEDAVSEIEIGDFIAADGVLSYNSYKDKNDVERESINVSATKLFHAKPVGREESAPAKTTRRKGKSKAGF